jgi:hypothetical protein
MLRSLSSRLLSFLVTLALGACAETATSDEVASSTTLLREYDKTLKKNELDAAVEELQSARVKQQQRAAGIN